MENYICPSCGKEFCKKVYKKAQAVYCSQSCAYKGRSDGTTKRTITKPYKCYRKPKRICVVCQDEFIYKGYNQKHCSRKCFEIAHKNNMSGKKNPAYKDGSSHDKRGWRGNDWETIRLEIYKRDNYVCQKCGVKCESKRDYKNSDNIIQCHHIENYNGKNNNDSNLITVCLKCHLKIHN